ncbi:MAG: COX15/CtaA family protein [Planctomycetota bacterium]|jgi:cytochrome c oxidase assembly protein subunit 15
MTTGITMTRHKAGGDLLVIAFGTTVAMWTILYIAAMPPGYAVLRVIAAFAVVGCLFGAGYAAGRDGGRSWIGGAGLGAILTGISLLVLLSLLGGREAGEPLMPTIRWILGFFATAVVLGALGAALGRPAVSDQAQRINWTAQLAWVTAITALLMLIAGGIVTGLEAGLAVEGWLIAEGHVLVLFPVSLMQRDVGTFAEHAHRLWGLLLGLTTLVLMARLWMTEQRAWPRWLSAAVVAAVVGQGVLGGTRVTEQSVSLAVVHGIFAPIILATLVVLAVSSSSAWLSDQRPTARASVRTDRVMCIVLVVAICVQIAVGSLFRHLQPEPGVTRTVLLGLLHGHSFFGALVVMILALFCGLRSWGLYGALPPLRWTGLGLLYVVILQVLLGIAAFIVVPQGPRDPEAAIPVVEVVLTTLHQANGAVLLATALALVAWQRRLLTVTAGGAVEPS